METFLNPSFVSVTDFADLISTVSCVLLQVSVKMLNKKRPRTVGLLSNEIVYLKVLCKHYFIFMFGSASFLFCLLYMLL